MAKVVPNAFIDPALAIDAGLTEVVVCAGQPTSFADIATRALASGTQAAPGIVAGSPDGRQASYAGITNVVITASGTADHVAYRDTPNSRYVVTTCPAVALVANGSNTVSVAATARRIGAVT